MIVGKAILEHTIPCFFRGEVKECKILVKLGFGEAHKLILSPGVVAFLNEGFIYIEGMFMSKCFSLDVKAGVARFVMNSNSFSILPMTSSPSSISMANAWLS